MKNELVPGTLSMLILRTIARIGPMHGYGIAQYVAQVSEDVLQIEEGTLYPALQKMLVKKWLTGEWRVTENGRRARYYSLTALGRKQLAAELEQFDRMSLAIRRVIKPA
ncbi:MAG: PadR family transcriptional regulator [Bryobacteraceae bacterium]